VGTVHVGVRNWLAAAVLLVTVTGCARSGNASGSASDLSGVHVSQIASSSASGLSVGTNAGTGTITGVVRTYGGPMMPNGQMADNGNPTSGVKLTATQNGGPVASTVTGTDGSYRFTLAPGTYVVTGCQDATIVVVAGQVTHQDIVCAVP
jgi:hypothetical protein